MWLCASLILQLSLNFHFYIIKRFNESKADSFGTHGCFRKGTGLPHQGEFFFCLYVGLNIWFREEMISNGKCLEHKSLVGISCDSSRRSIQKLDQPAYYTMSTQKDQCLHTQMHTINTLVFSPWFYHSIPGSDSAHFQQALGPIIILHLHSDTRGVGKHPVSCAS